MQITAEIERYDEANSRVKINFYRSWAKRIVFLCALEEVPEYQANAIVATTNRDFQKKGLSKQQRDILIPRSEYVEYLQYYNKQYGDIDEDC